MSKQTPRRLPEILSDIVNVAVVPIHAPVTPSEPPEAAEAKDLPQDVGERVLEVPVSHHVDDGVQGGVEVADPEEDGYHDVWARAGLGVADSDGEVPEEERHPADEEGPHDNAQGHEGLVLLPPGRVDPVPLPEPWKIEKNGLACGMICLKYGF